MDRFTQYAVVKRRQAVEDAKLEINDETANRIGVWIVQGLVVWKRLKQHIQHFKIRVQEE